MTSWFPPPDTVPEEGAALNQATEGDSARLKLSPWLPELLIVKLSVPWEPLTSVAERLLSLKEMLAGVYPVPVTAISTVLSSMSLLVIVTLPE
ncbi:MAG: hypothetical protein BWX83_01264 [Candidatus Cloacimonetes bacterium ADurb.Bin117]|nr:MAG: hypothetical protein BWX83_01264 [Candidatus Cloacimonetes bacterium ADurb.Bin117]